MKLLTNLFKRKTSSTPLNTEHLPVFSEQITVPTSGTRSSQVSKTASLIGGLVTNGGFREEPHIGFDKRIEFYMTVGKIQNVVDAMVLDITNRAFFFKDTTDGGKGGAYSHELRSMEMWEKSKVQLSEMFAETVRNWLINGVHIISPMDWQPMQLRSIKSKIRDNNGITKTYVQVINGKEGFLDATKFLEVPYINMDVAAWGVGLFDSIMNRNYLDVDGKQPNSTLEIYRQTLQDQGRILHKFSSPRVYYMPGDGVTVSKDTIDNDIVPVIEATTPGDRSVISQRMEILTEEIDGKARFTEYADDINDEVDAGLQSSKNRLLTDPSAMADAREAGEQDDDRSLGLMEKLRVFMNKTVIPHVLGIDAGWIEFVWGEKDAFHLEIPPALLQSVQAGIIAPEQALMMLKEQYEWNIPELTPELQRKQDDRLNMNNDNQDMLNPKDKKNNDEALKSYRALQRQERIMYSIESELEALK